MAAELIDCRPAGLAGMVLPAACDTICLRIDARGEPADAPIRLPDLDRYEKLRELTITVVGNQSLILGQLPLALEELDIDREDGIGPISGVDLSGLNSLRDLLVNLSNPEDIPRWKIPLTIVRMGVRTDSRLTEFDLSGLEQVKELELCTPQVQSWSGVRLPRSLEWLGLVGLREAEDIYTGALPELKELSISGSVRRLVLGESPRLTRVDHGSSYQPGHLEEIDLSAAVNLEEVGMLSIDSANEQTRLCFPSGVKEVQMVECSKFGTLDLSALSGLARGTFRACQVRVLLLPAIARDRIRIENNKFGKIGMVEWR